MEEPIWIKRELLEAIHDRQLAEHGGSSGIRDGGLLESALARPQQLFAYGGAEVDTQALAASLAWGLARNHPFVDGNKRSAIVACEVFLELNGLLLIAGDEDLYPLILGAATGELSEEQLAEWLRRHTRPMDDRVNEEPGSYR